MDREFIYDFLEYTENLDIIKENIFDYDDVDDLLKESFNTAVNLAGEEEQKIVALAKLENLSFDDAKSYIEDEDFLVLTEEEADDRWEQELDYYLEECVYPELPENMKSYFDDEAWKRDARFDGRGHSIARYDGNENYEEVNGTTYYIYRMN